MNEAEITKEIRDIKDRLKRLEQPHVSLSEEEAEYFAPEVLQSEIVTKVEALLETLRRILPEFSRTYEQVHTKMQNDKLPDASVRALADRLAESDQI
ncbi:hypothetical protein [Acidicapsa acidisoli]|uniref:hypothetical protein n=1 Tax=Acidicapsa acidisoli TaxID=1615681 RepID=UPI0021E0AFD8|nr:hypothetical protein [Acidicapsa acidisoli]